MDNAQNGFSLHRLNGDVCIREYVTGVPRRTYPKQVDFAEGSRVIVGGSDHSMVYIFDRKTGAVLQKLHHGRDELVQTIAVRQPTVPLCCNLT
jgi:hypothetical protein